MVGRLKVALSQTHYATDGHFNLYMAYSKIEQTLKYRDCGESPQLKSIWKNGDYTNKTKGGLIDEVLF